MNEEKKITRLQELEMNEEFQKLPEDKKVILIAGEKILEMDQYFKNLFSQFINSSGKMHYIPKEANQAIVDNILKILEEKQNLSNLNKEEVLKLIDQRYNDELSSLENKYQYETQRAIRNMDESFNDTLQRVENLSQFQIQAREEIRKNQDKLYILEEELIRQKEANNSLKKVVDESIDNSSKKYDDSLTLNNYEFLGKEFSNFEELKDFIRDEARLIAENEIEKYLHEKDLFSDDLNDDLKQAIDNKNISDFNTSELYAQQIANDSKLSDLEKLISQQNDQLKLLGEERKKMLLSVANLIKDNKVTSTEEFIEILNMQPYCNYIDINSDEISGIEVNKNNHEALSDSEIELLVKKQAIELLREKIKEYDGNPEKLADSIISGELDDNSPLLDISTMSISGQNQIKSLNQVNEEISKIEKNINDYNQNISNFDNFLQYNTSNSSISHTNSGMINLDYDNYWSLNYEDDMSKHNYYDASKRIIGTKITRINSYKINNDIDDVSFGETEEIIKTEIDKSPIFNETNSSNNNLWEENNQKIVDLENLVQKQEEELNRLRYQNQQNQLNQQISNEVRERNIIQNTNNIDNEKQKEFMNSLEMTLNQLKELSNIQAQTVADLEKQSKKLDEIEQKVKNPQTENRYVTHDNLDQIISEKYKSQKINEAYVDELKKVEEERKRIEEALELERMRLMSEISRGKEKLNSIKNNNDSNEENQQNENNKTVVETKSEVVILETPKKKRKQQIFYEVKVHDRPKLTRADLEK